MHQDRNGWRVRWRSNGQRHSRLFSDRKAAAKFELELKLGIADATPAGKRSPTFREFAAVYLSDYAAVTKAKSGHRDDASRIEQHLVPLFGDLRLTDLRKAHLEQAKAELARKPTRQGQPRPEGKPPRKALSPVTVNLILALAKKMLGVAVDLGYLDASPWAGVKRLKVGEQPFDYWTPTERDLFLARASQLDPAFCELVAVACHTGLRLGELGALRRDDLDFDRRLIRVDEALDLLSGETHPTKNRTVAYVPMNEAARKVLITRLPQGPGDWVFHRPLVGNARKRLARLAKAVGSRPIRFHDLRHTFASALAMAGTDLLVIQRLCRHKSYAMTLRYAHLHPDHLRGATEVLCGPRLARTEEGRLKSHGPTGT